MLKRVVKSIFCESKEEKENEKLIRELMATVQQVTEALGVIGQNISRIDTKADELARLIRELKAGQVTQEEIDGLLAAVETVKTASGAVAAEVDQLGGPDIVVEPTEPQPAPVEEEQP